MADMGMFRTTVGIESLSLDGVIRELADTMVDTGSEFTWIPADVLEERGIERQRQQRFRVADGRVLVRDMGFAIVHVAGISLPDLVVFAEPNDATLIGVHTIEGLNLKIDVMKKELVDAGPIITASAA